MTDAPERIWIDRGPNGGWMYRPKKVYDSQHNYIRSDLHQQALAEAEARGYARGMEALTAERAEVLKLREQLGKVEEVLEDALKYNTAMHGGAGAYNKRIKATIAALKGDKP